MRSTWLTLSGGFFLAASVYAQTTAEQAANDRASIELIRNLPSILIALGTFVASVGALIMSIVTSRRQAETKKDLKEVHDLTNSMSAKLLKAEKAESHALGVTETETRQKEIAAAKLEGKTAVDFSVEDLAARVAKHMSMTTVQGPQASQNAATGAIESAANAAEAAADKQIGAAETQTTAADTQIKASEAQLELTKELKDK